jgi:diacylglycerol kinase (ATP)
MPQPWVAIQYNPHSGAGKRRGALMDLARHLRDAGIRPRLFSDRPRMKSAIEHPDRRDALVGIVAAGGDGTVADVFNSYPGVPLAILPLGTENLLARYLRIPPSGRHVAGLIALGRTRTFDLCAIGTRRFAIMASVGFDADVVRQTHERRRGHISRLDYLQPILHSLRRFPYPELRVTVDGDAAPTTARLAVVANLPIYALRLPVVPAAIGNDGLVDVRLLSPQSPYQMLQEFFKVAVLRSSGPSRRGARVRIESDEPVPVQIDGDPAGWTPIEIVTLPGALTVFANP